MDKLKQIKRGMPLMLSSRIHSWLQPFFALAVFGIAAPLAAEEKLPAEHVKFFEMKVRPLLVEKCFKCHGPDKQNSDLRLDARADVLQGGESGPAIVPGKPEESLLIEAVKWESFEMPPSGKMDDEQVATLTRWVKLGAPWPGSHGKSSRPVRTAADKISDEDRQWWAFQPVKKPDVPDKLGDWGNNPVDHFIARKLKEKGLRPAPAADRRTLIRRVYFDLTGLPPRPEEIESFVNDKRDNAYELLIDRLLESKRYGERWGRHWLDLVRYAESDGWRQDAYRPHAWRYRDYVIKSFNDDKPYNRFVMEQLAGDEIDPDNPEALAATGFLRLGIYEYNQRDAETQWAEIVNETTDVTADVFLASGMACARCHDHKFDPLLREDYYRMRAFFAPMVWEDDVPYATTQQKQTFQDQRAQWEKLTAEIRQKIEAIEKPHREAYRKGVVEKFPTEVQAMYYKDPKQRTWYEEQLAYLVHRQVIDKPDEYKARIKGEEKKRWESLREELASFEKKKPKSLPVLMTVRDAPRKPSPTFIPGKERKGSIAPGFLTVLNEKPATIAPLEREDSTGRRTTLARWIARDDNPLSTRVIANRVWQYHFGKGIVPTTSDFGHLGQAPTHPELLDWLTTTLLENDWRLKPLHRLILLSATYRQSSTHPRAYAFEEIDPANDYYWRASVRRLDAEQIRDAMLSVSGELSLEMGGPSVTHDKPRRSVYCCVVRNSPDPLLNAFDAPNGMKSMSDRNVTTTATQSLLMINGSYTLKRASAMAKRLAALKERDPTDVAAHAFQLAWGRVPDQDCLDGAVALLKEPGKEGLVDFCHVLLNSNEFLYVD